MVLVAEDNDTARFVVRAHLDVRELQLVFANDGSEAVLMAEATRFDLILMDLSMPVMDGLQAIRAIRSREGAQGLRRTPILVVSARTSAEDVRASLKAGADDHIGKPVSRTELLQRMRQLTSVS